jgi:hypothetical protein
MDSTELSIGKDEWAEIWDSMSVHQEDLYEETEDIRSRKPSVEALIENTNPFETTESNE